MAKTSNIDTVPTFPHPVEGLTDVGAGTLDRTNRTFICTVLFLDIVEYSKKPVSKQLRVKEQFNAHLSEALQDIAANDRIILDTGDGAAINFLGDPEDALFVAISLAQAFTKPSADALPMDVRIGINLGPVRLVRDINGQPNIIGDGINVAERVMSFGSSGQVLVSRSYFEVVTRISEDYSQMFAYQGSRTDKHVREHEIYAVAVVGTDALAVATRRHRARPSPRPALKLVDTTQAGPQAHRTWLRRIRLPYALATISCLALMLAIVYFVSDRAANRASGAARFGPAIRLADAAVPPSTESHTATAGAQREASKTAASGESTRGTTASTGQSGAGEAQSSRSVLKKSALAHKVSGAAHTASEAPAAVPVAVKAPAAEPPSPAPVAPWHPYNDEHKAAPSASASGANIGAASPYTAAAPKAATALVMLAVSPWGEVMVDGKSVGVSPPLSELELTPGTHQVEIRNGDFTPHLVTLQLDANQTIKIKHKFKQR